jgi:starch synthase
LKILFASSELYPLIKTGGLADVTASLPSALKKLGQDIKIMLPAYRDALKAAEGVDAITTLQLAGQTVGLLRTLLPESGLEVWLVDAALFDRPGNPYLANDGTPWKDNAARFALFCRAIAAVAMRRANLTWQPDIVHCHDWQTALTCVLLATEPQRPAIVYTIHNLSYQGVFPYATFAELHLPDWQRSPEALAFHGQLSFVKGGLVYADRINAVSRGYAREIQTPEFGCGLDGLLSRRQAALSGIVNGIDTEAWDPARDPLLVKNYDQDRLEDKQANKAALQDELELPQHSGVALIGMISRLVEQKGIDLLLDALPGLIELPVQIVLLGAGQPEYEQALLDRSRREPTKIRVHIGHDEALAHRIEAGADMFLMPSRFEPCGLNQMYSQRYGTVPIVRRTGGLQDTVVDTSPETLAAGTANGVMFDEATGPALVAAVQRALASRKDKRLWRQLRLNGMRQDFSWQRSAREYLALYTQALRDRGHASTGAAS